MDKILKILGSLGGVFKSLNRGDIAENIGFVSAGLAAIQVSGADIHSAAFWTGVGMVFKGACALLETLHVLKSEEKTDAK